MGVMTTLQQYIHTHTYLEFVQSSYKISNSLHEISLHRLTPGWIAPSPRRIRTCSTLHTTGVMSRRLSLVYTVWSPPTRCLRKSSKAWGRHINSRPSTINAATFAPRYSINLHTLFSGWQATGGGELYVPGFCSLLIKFRGLCPLGVSPGVGLGWVVIWWGKTWLGDSIAIISKTSSTRVRQGGIHTKINTIVFMPVPGLASKPRPSSELSSQRAA